MLLIEMIFCCVRIGLSLRNVVYRNGLDPEHDAMQVRSAAVWCILSY